MTNYIKNFIGGFIFGLVAASFFEFMFFKTIYLNILIAGFISGIMEIINHKLDQKSSLTTSSD